MTTEPTAVAAESGFSIESIKEIMDGFDPAALLPELDSIFGLVLTICRVAVMVGPVLLLLLGLIYLFLAPKEANHYLGYRCYFGMGSVEAWRFTQRIAGLVLAGLGLVLGVVMLIISLSFPGMAVSDLVWKALWCLVWQAGLALAANLGISITAAVMFDHKGEYRRKRTAE